MSTLPSGKPINVTVIGAGIVGATISYSLAKRGACVTVIDRNYPGSGATSHSFAWINASYFDQPDSYFNLRTHSLNEYHRLSAELGFPISWGGGLEWNIVEGVTLRGEYLHFDVKASSGIPGNYPNADSGDRVNFNDVDVARAGINISLSP